MSLHDEFELIRGIQGVLGRPSRRVILGIGDDAAVVKPPKGNLVATVDTMVEGVHFDLAYTTPQELGYKALAVNLSDMAAMGATPLYALVSVGLQQSTTEHFVGELYQGIRKLAKRFDVDIIGGNTVQSPTATVIDISLIGEASKTFITRSGARVGDLIAVTGPLGESAAGLNCLKRLGRQNLDRLKGLVNAHLMPEPRVKEALALVKTGAVTSMIDISDGFARDLHHLTGQSKVGALIDEAAIPISDLTRKGGELVSTSPRGWALYGGEDYELLFTFNPKKLSAVKKALGKSFYIVGEILPIKQKVKIKNAAGEIGLLEPRGWNHFVRRSRLKNDPETVLV